MDERKKIRKGTKSCLECRRRKIRCNFAQGGNDCEQCIANGRTCSPQLYRQQSNTPKARLTAQQRIKRLELQIARIAATATADSSNAEAESTYDEQDDDSDESEMSEAATSPPDHLRLLFDIPRK